MRFKIQLSAGWVRKDCIYDLSESEAYEICSEHNWEYLDDNMFCWNMDYVEDM